MVLFHKLLSGPAFSDYQTWTPNDPQLQTGGNAVTHINESPIVETTLVGCSKSTFTDPQAVSYLTLPKHSPTAFTTIGKEYEGHEPDRYGPIKVQGDDIIFDPGYREYLHLKLKHPTFIKAIDINTAWFKGNPADHVTITFYNRDTGESQLVTKTPLSLVGDSSNIIRCDSSSFLSTDVVVRMTPGGIARVYVTGDSQSTKYIVDTPFTPIDNEQPPEPGPKQIALSHSHNTEYNELERGQVSIMDNAKVLLDTDSFFGTCESTFKNRRQVPYMLGWETRRINKLTLGAFQLEKPATPRTWIIDTYQHINNAQRMAYLFGKTDPSASSNFDILSYKVTEFYKDHQEQKEITNLQPYLENAVKAKEKPNKICLSPSKWTNGWALLHSTTGGLKPNHLHIFKIRNPKKISEVATGATLQGGIHAMRLLSQQTAP